MLKEGSFYNITTFNNIDNSLTATIEINASHAIFEGHFPSIPVVPGVCMMQLLKEIAEKAIGVETMIAKASNLKFLTVINPLENSKIEVELSYKPQPNDCISIEGRLFNEATTFFKMRGLLQLQQTPTF